MDCLTGVEPQTSSPRWNGRFIFGQHGLRVGLEARAATIFVHISHWQASPTVAVRELHHHHSRLRQTMDTTLCTQCMGREHRQPSGVHGNSTGPPKTTTRRSGNLHRQANERQHQPKWNPQTRRVDGTTSDGRNLSGFAFWHLREQATFATNHRVIDHKLAAARLVRQFEHDFQHDIFDDRS